jgi:hypothetical protein
LPSSGGDVEFGDGPSVVPLVRGAHSAALVAKPYRAALVHLTRPCTP